MEILSHMWWKEEEPSYKTFSKQHDCERKRQKTVRGYRKPQWFCDIAHRVYGIEFAWADTVCIDKSSSMELDESIHSMFAWYRNLDVCIMHLAETTNLLDCPSDLLTVFNHNSSDTSGFQTWKHILGTSSGSSHALPDLEPLALFRNHSRNFPVLFQTWKHC